MYINFINANKLIRVKCADFKSVIFLLNKKFFKQIFSKYFSILLDFVSILLLFFNKSSLIIELNYII